MREKKFKKAQALFTRMLALAMVLAACVLMSGCVLVDPANAVGAPFDSTKYKGKNVDEITRQLEEAGFTNIQMESDDTTVESLADEVISIKIGSNTSWNSANTWNPDTLVKVKYYNYTGIRHIDVTVDVTVGGEDGMPVFTVNTNLPDGTALYAELSFDGVLENGREDYVETQNISVQDGTAQTEAFTLDGEPLTGNYLFSLLMLPAEQTEAVQEVIGASGEAMRGDAVEASGEYQYVHMGIEYESPIEEPEPEIEKISEAELDERFKNALVGFGDNYNVSCEGYLYTVQVWQDGLALLAAKAVAGEANAIEQWKQIADTTAQASESLGELLIISGYGEYLVQLQVMNDENLDNYLLEAYLGMITYDCVNDG